jgi:hypothetical protein
MISGRSVFQIDWFDVVAVDGGRASIAVKPNSYNCAVEPAADYRAGFASEPRRTLHTKRTQLDPVAGLKLNLFGQYDMAS